MQAAAAIVPIANSAAVYAFRAATVLATTADAFAAATDRLVADLAHIRFVLIHEPAAVRTITAVPDLECHKRTLLVVGPQAVGHEREEIQESAL